MSEQLSLLTEDQIPRERKRLRPATILLGLTEVQRCREILAAK